MLRRKLLGMSGIADIGGEPMQVQVVGESDGGRLVVERGGSRHVVTREAFVEQIAIAPEPVSEDVRTAAITLAQAIERAKAMVGTDHLLRQEDYQILVDELDDTERYPFAAALIEQGVQVRTGRRADQDVVTHPDDSGAGEPGGAGQDGPDQPGFFPWTPVDSTPSNESAHTEHDFPGVRQIEGSYGAGDDTIIVWSAKGAPSKRHYKTCPMVERLRNRGMPGRFVILTEEQAVDEQLEERGYPIKNCACVKGMPLPLWDPVEFGEDVDADKLLEQQAEGGWSGSELVNERWAQASMSELLDHPRKPPESELSEQIHETVEPAAEKVAQNQTNETTPSHIWRDAVEMGVIDKAGTDVKDVGAVGDWLREPTQHDRILRAYQAGEAVWMVVDEMVLRLKQTALANREDRNNPNQVLRDQLREKDADLTSPSGRDRALNPSVHEQIGDAYRSDNQWEDPDLHLGMVRAFEETLFGESLSRQVMRVRALRPDAPATPPPYGPDNPWGDDRTMWDDLDPQDGEIVQLHAQEETVVKASLSMQDLVKKLVHHDDEAKAPTSAIARRMADAFRLSTDVSLEGRRRIAARVAQEELLRGPSEPPGLDYKPMRGEDFGLSHEEARIIDYFVAKLRDPGPPDMTPPPPWQPPLRERLILSFVGAPDMSEIDTVSEQYKRIKVPLYAWALKNAILRDGYKSIDWIQEFEGGVARKIAAEYLPRNANILVDLNDPRTVQMGGMLFLRDSKGRAIVANLDLDSGYNPPTISIYARRGQQRAANDFLKAIQTRAYTDNFYRGKLLTIEGTDRGGVLTFLPMERVAWQNVILPDEVIQEIRDNTVEILRHKATLGPRIGLKRSLLMLGHPGTGKSIAAKATATEALRMHEADCTVIWVTGQSIKWSDHIKDLYEAAKELAPTMLIYEDIDQIGGDRWKSSGQRNELLAELLTSMDGAESNDGIITLASSNDVKLDLLDVALADRPGRFDRKVSFPLPAPEHRETMLARFLLGMGADLGEDVTETRWAGVVTGTAGMTGAYLKELAKTAVIRAVQRQPADRVASSVVLVMSADLDEALRVTRQNLEYRSRVAQVSDVGSVAPSSGMGQTPGMTNVPAASTGDGGMGVAGDSFETTAEGEGIEQPEGEGEPKEPAEFGVLTSLSMRQVRAQGVDNRLSDPNVQTDVDEQQGDRAIPRPPEDEPIRYSMRDFV